MISSQDRKYKVLIITAPNPYIGPGGGALNLYNGLRERGNECDILTKDEILGHPEILYVYKHKPLIYSLIIKALKKIGAIFRLNYLCVNPHAPHYFFYRLEESPPVKVSRVIKKISKQYNVVHICFWQGLLSFKTVEAIYDKLHCQIHFAGVDYSHMSGGCHFTIDCLRYKIGCGKCPAWDSNQENDFTHKNVEYREHIYKKVRPIVWGNTYMKLFYEQSYLLHGYDRVETAVATIDETLFKPLKTEPLRSKLHVDERKKFIILFGSQNINDERKGFEYLRRAFNILYKKLSKDEINEILLMTIGKNKEEISLPFDTQSLGYVSYAQLPEVYSLANLFVCPSVYDAGPLMVNQAIMCGTPVVGFEIGSLLDVVKNKGTGLCAKYKNAQSLSICIEQIYYLFKNNNTAYSDMRDACRKVGIAYLSKEKQLNRILSAYEKYST